MQSTTGKRDFPVHGKFLYLCRHACGYSVELNHRGNLDSQLFKIILFPHVNISYRIETLRTCFEIHFKNVVILKL